MSGKAGDSEVGSTARALDALRELGEAVITLETCYEGLEAYELKLYPEGASLRQSFQLEKDPKWRRLWRAVKRSETAEWACMQLVRKRARALAKREQKV